MRDNRKEELTTNRLGVGHGREKEATIRGRFWAWMAGRMVIPLTKIGYRGSGAGLRGKMTILFCTHWDVAMFSFLPGTWINSLSGKCMKMVNGLPRPSGGIILLWTRSRPKSLPGGWFYWQTLIVFYTEDIFGKSILYNHDLRFKENPPGVLPFPHY